MRTEIASVTVRWPNGQREAIEGVSVDGHFEIVEGRGKATRLERPARGQQLVASNVTPLPSTDVARIVLGRRVSSSRYLSYQSLTGESQLLYSTTGRPKLVLLWATWCPNCLKEMVQLAAEREDFEARGVEVLALNVDSLQPNRNFDSQLIAKALERIGWPYASGIATSEVMQSLEGAQKSFVLKQGPMRLPTSFLFDSRSQLAIIYKGPVGPEQLASDLGVLSLSPSGIFQAACPFPGRWKPEMPQLAVPQLAGRPRRQR